MRKWIWVVMIVMAMGLSLNVVSAQDEPRPLLMTHYMPWYQSPDVRGYWGWHWTMEHFNPFNKDENGRREIASHYMPLTGAYDSSDPDVLEYQVLLMKLSGIDGVIVDWYGVSSFRDYALINDSTVLLFDYVKRAGLKFTLCYEDQTIKHRVTESNISADEANAEGAKDLTFAQENWFTDEAYLKHNGSPLLFVFGPQYFRSPEPWNEMFSTIEPAPSLVTLDGHMDWAALSSYPWPPMEYAGGATMAPAVLESYLDLFYRNARRRDVIVGSAFPGFHDIYEEADVRSSYGYLDPQDGAILRLTLERALQANASIIQLVTWNDYGEGTIIEPTEEFGYQRLEIVQETRQSLDTAFTATSDDLILPLRLFKLRRAHEDDADINAQLDEVFNAIVAGDLTDARTILDGLDGG